MSYTTTVPAPGSCRVFKTGTTYVAQDYQGKILSTSTTDASIVINAAISGIPGAAARGMGGRVFIHAGDYDCKTQITMDQSISRLSCRRTGRRRQGHKIKLCSHRSGYKWDTYPNG